ncbi:SMP-30/gluconolactonase/LRE family protein [Aestuariivivens sp. NBU2969]|uniref:SMP-30/gluconolactonase/LRE family protein n=1 Tax=Aestuariivivens sp. NBU2969 TaxID=2873267 RepID=UPI001CBFBFDA|nr:SMP-30/gluconolactonase/LRE family protein [Aestuariivivens sp. NBU2969]
MKPSIYSLFLFTLTILSCNQQNSNNNIDVSEKTNEQLPNLTYNDSNLFPGDGSLLRAEDGVSLEDGRIIVVDQAKGLRLIQKDGSNRPFGDFSAAGFLHLPPEQIAGPNGMILEHDGQHVLMSDITDGKIYRININTEKVELIYDHPYGVNTIYRDKTGALWFSQSAENNNMGEMFQAANLPVPTGAVFRMNDLKSTPVKILDSLYFANGITMDSDEKHLFVAETMMDRVHKLEVDNKTGEVNYIGVAANVGTPDNLLIDNEGRLIVASPLYNQVIAVDFKRNSQYIIFDGSTKDNLKITNEWKRRSHLGMERLELISPDLFNPLPGLLTGMFYSNDGQTLYIANLGNDLLKLDYK